MLLGVSPVVRSRWSTPSHRWVKLNVDALVSSLDHKAGVGGVIRDEFSFWLLGFTRFLGHYDVLAAALWAIHDSLLQGWNSGYSRVELESNCLEAVSIINSSSDALIGSALVDSVKELIAREWSIVVRHVSRVNNRVADMLASRGRGSDVAQVIFLSRLLILHR
ncbi:hypothetical protein V6N12_013467 [Hibiscus sabdariffa]|uniref:RNase H type-1 domain-containing protein n=1 Tax=Hibiscus sabdariffa TaxID=183260 RepID=A0ABR2BHM2_9ROSI